MYPLLMALCLTVTTPASLKAEKKPATLSIHHSSRNASEKATLARLKAIRELAKTRLSKEEKKALREEVKAIKEKSSRPGGAIYISTGALVLIIVLLIILL